MGPPPLDNDGSGQVGNTDHQVTENEDFIASIDVGSERVNDGIVEFCIEQRTLCPASSVLTIELKVDNVPDGYYMVEPSDSILRYPLISIPNALVSIVRGTVRIQVMNRYDHDHILYPNMRVGVGFQVNIVDSRMRRYEIPENWVSSAEVNIPDDVRPILEQYRDRLNEGLFSIILEPVTVPTGDSAPIFRKPYRLSDEERRKVREQVDKLLREGVIRESSSIWGAPCFLVDKKSGDSRLVIDYTALNRVTEPDPYPLVDMTDAVQSLSRSGWFSHLDLDSAYHQVPVASGDIPKTCFVTDNGSYEYLFAPFGLNRSGAALARNLDRILGPLTKERVINYSDDIVVHGPSRDQALQSLQLTLFALASCGLFIKLAKCIFLVRSIHFLGFVVSEKGISPDPENVEAVMKIDHIIDKKHLSRFVNFASFYRQFVRNFASVVAPLRQLLGSKDWEWSEQCQKAFCALKKALCTPPVLAYFDPERETFLKTDASKGSFGAVLMQKDSSREYVVAYASRKTTEIESRSWAVTHLELGAIIFAVQRFKRFLQGIQFTILTDHHALCWLLGQKNTSGKLARWTILLQEYRFNVVYTRPTALCDADCLSRANVQNDGVVAAFVQDEISQVQSEDLYCHSLRVSEDFTTRNGILCKIQNRNAGPEYRVVVPASMRDEIIGQSHETVGEEYVGVEQVLVSLQHSYFWPNMRASIQKYVRSNSKRPI